MSYVKYPSFSWLLCATLLACASHERVNVGNRLLETAAGSSTRGVDGAGGAGRDPNVQNPNGTPVTNATSVPMSAGVRRMAGGAGSSPASNGSKGPTPNPTPVFIDKTGTDNPAGLSAADVAQLMAGGPLGDMKWLYPYDETLFPRGMLAPLVMWNGDAAADALYLHIKSKLFDYKAALKPTDTKELALANLFTPLWNQVASTIGTQATGKQLLIPQEIWDLAGASALGSDDTFTLELSERANGRVRGLITSHIRFAQADFKGSIYYSACTSANPDAGNTGLSSIGGNGKVLRIPPGGTAELVLSRPGQQDERCQGCHTVSADGSRLIAQRAPTSDDYVQQRLTMGIGMSYQLDPGGVDLGASSVGPNAAYGALYPDGTKFLSTAVPAPTPNTDDPDYWLFSIGYVFNWGAMGTPKKLIPATLYDASTGAVTPDTGVPQGALMPTFSPDGKRLVFNDLSIAGAHGLAMMHYDTRSHKASDYEVLVQESSTGPTRPGWPFFLPDDKAVVFVRTESTNFTSYRLPANAAAANTDALPGANSDLYIVDVASRKVTLLAKAMGFSEPADADDKTYLPFTKLDLHRNYFPTVSQVAAGGYFWVFFDTWRHYGNLGVQRGLWGFALDIRPDGYTTDPSHPPFYVPGQEFGAGNNHRAFVALDPCKQQGDACTSAIGCCAGTTCTFAEATTPTQRGLRVGTCSVPPPPASDQPVCPNCTSCAKLDERCTSAADCCDSSHYCINGFCAFVDLL